MVHWRLGDTDRVRVSAWSCSPLPWRERGGGEGDLTLAAGSEAVLVPRRASVLACPGRRASADACPTVRIPPHPLPLSLQGRGEQDQADTLSRPLNERNRP